MTPSLRFFRSALVLFLLLGLATPARAASDAGPTPSTAMAVPDLEFSTDVTDAYEAYLIQQDQAFLAQIEQGGDTPERARALMGRALVLAALIHVDLVHALNEDDDLDDAPLQIQQHIERLRHAHLQFDASAPGMATQLRDLFLGSRVADVHHRLRTIRAELTTGAASAAALYARDDATIRDYLRDIGDHLETLADLSAEFTLNFTVDDEGEFIVSRTTIDDFEALGDDAEAAAENLDDAAGLLDDLMDGHDYVEDFTATLQLAIGDLRRANDRIMDMLTRQPFEPMGLDDDLFEALNDVFDELDYVLDGGTYNLGVDDKTIRPLALIENLPEGNAQLFLDFYRMPLQDRFAYTFGGLFPLGLPEDLVTQLTEDAVVNVADSRDAFRTRMEALKQQFSTALATDPADNRARIGRATADIYLLVDKHFDRLEAAVEFLADGDPTGMLDELQNLSLAGDAATLESIAADLEAVEDADDVLFVLLVKTGEEPSDPYGIDSGDDYVPLVLIHTDFNELAGLIRDLNAGDAVTETIAALFDGSSDFMDTYLDPNAVDFEPGQSPLEVIEMLQNANPTFMRLTAEGKEQMRDAGGVIRDELGRYVEELHDLRDFIDRASKLDAELELDAEALRKAAAWADSMAQRVHADFLDPAEAVRIDGETVNLSAWFDEPPDNLMNALKWFLDDDEDTDNTFGGLFPERGFGTPRTDGDPGLPTAFEMHPLYPNPAYRTATLTVDLPERSTVRVQVYDVLGRERAVALDEIRPAGRHEIALDVGALPSGMYLVRLQTGSRRVTDKLIITR